MTKYHKLSDFFNAIIGGEWGQEPISTKAVSVLRTTNFRNDGTVDYTDIALRNISPSKIKEKALAYQDIIIEKSGGSDKQPVGRVVFFENESGKFLCNNFTQILRVDQTNYYPRYVFYYLYSLYLSGATLPYQNKTTGIRNLQLAAYLNLSVKHDVPNRIEQKRIAERLDKVQELIAKQKEQIAKLDLLIKSCFLDMFGDPISNPKKWPTRRMGDIFKITSGGTPSRKKSENFENGTIPWVKTGDLNIPVLTHTDECITEIGLQNSSAKLFPVGTVLLAMYGATIGAVSILGIEACSNQACAAFLPVDTISPIYLYFFLFLQKQHFIKLGVGGAQPNISGEILKREKILCPPIVLQTQFANFVKSVERQKEVVSSRLSHLETLYKSLMQEYFG